MSEKQKSELFEWIQAIVFAVVLAFIIRTFLFEFILVEGSSMVPTLHDGDRIAVNKLIYRISKPKSGDIVIFRNPGDPSTNFIKRVIGVEGDRVAIRDGAVYVNDKKLDEPYINEVTIGNFDEITVPKDTIFVLGDNRNHSRDSRDPGVGCIPLGNLFGKAKLRIWPISDIEWFQ